MRLRIGLTLVAVLALGGLTCGCQTGDPKAKIQEQRARWTVQPLNWVQTEDGSVNLSLRITGPPSTPLEQLTVRVDLLDAGGKAVDVAWRTFDLAEIPRGGPKDVAVRIPNVEQPVEELGVSLMLEATPEEERRIPELQVED
jgi:hypothetical protein